MNVIERKGEVIFSTAKDRRALKQVVGNLQKGEDMRKEEEGEEKEK